MKKKTLTVAIALVLVVALAVGATYAYLTAKTETVTNTFTVGKTIDDPETGTIIAHDRRKIRRNHIRNFLCGFLKYTICAINAKGKMFTIFQARFWQ